MAINNQTSLHAMCQIPLQSNTGPFTVGVPLGPSDANGNNNYPAAGIASITLVSAGLYRLELEQAAGSAATNPDGIDELNGQCTVASNAPALANFLPAQPNQYPSIFGGVKDSTFFRLVTITTAATDAVPAASAVNVLITRYPNFGQAAQG